jgi:hypothetical protein
MVAERPYLKAAVLIGDLDEPVLHLGPGSLPEGTAWPVATACPTRTCWTGHIILDSDHPAAPRPGTEASRLPT